MLIFYGKSGFYLSLFFLITLVFFPKDLGAKEIRGVVRNETSPISEAIVRVRATTICDTTDSEGRFILSGIHDTDSLMVTAWKDGYYIKGKKASPGEQSLMMILEKYTEEDNQNYTWLAPESNKEDSTSCSTCHYGPILQQWKSNLHSLSAKDPILLSLYNGTDLSGNFGVEPGFMIDFPGSAGSCANCHAPTAALKDGSWATDLNAVAGVDTNGVFCDFCHKIVDAQIDRFGSSPGFMSIELRRPSPERQLFIGSLDDVVGDDAYLPIYKNSLICAPCHQFFNGKTPIYTSFFEWQTSSYARQGIECQDCHMVPDSITTNFAPGHGGVERDPMTIPSHNQMGGNDSLFISKAVVMEVNTSILQDTLIVEVEVRNTGAGHHFPTGNPMRQALLIIQAMDDNKNPLEYIGTEIVPEWGGEGTEFNDYAGQPGKGFARILSDQKGKAPAPQWRVTLVKADTRIPANKSDHSTYTFLFSPEDQHISINTKLIYRKGFKSWADAKGWDLEDYIVAEDSIRLIVTSIRESNEENEQSPETLFLRQNYPNPFNSGTVIEFKLNKGAFVIGDIYNLEGQKIIGLIEGYLPAGIHSIDWDGKDEYGAGASSGVYFCCIRVGSQILSRKLLFLR